MAELYTIKSAAAKSGMSQVYIRRAIRQGDLATELQPISEGSKTLQHVFPWSAFEEWRATRGGGSRRQDGRNKFVFYANKETEIDAIKEAIAEALPDYDVDELVGLANPPKK